MGTKYSSQSISGYNASPPSDDGSQAASNRVNWSKHKTKLADPIKTLSEAINTALVTALDTSIRAISSNDTLTAADHWKTIQVTAATAGVTVTLADAATMAAGYIVSVHNIGASSGNVTIALATASNTLNSLTNGTIVIPPDAALEFIVGSPATGYIAKNGFGANISRYGRFDVSALTAARVYTLPNANLTIPAVTAKGDIVAASASGTLARVAVSATNGDVLIADSAASAGVSYRTKITLGTEQASTSGTSIDFTSIPSWAKKITIMFVGVSTSGTSNPLIQIGTGGSPTTSGYLGSSTSPANGGATTGANYTTGFGIAGAQAANVMHGHIFLTLEDSSDNTWVCSHVIGYSNTAASSVGGGRVALSGALDMVRITTVGGSDTFDAGAINIQYE